MAEFGSEVAPNGPLQDMSAIDTIAGSVHARDASEAEFTGGTGGGGLGGMAEPAAADKLNAPGGGPTPGASGSPLSTSAG